MPSVDSLGAERPGGLELAASAAQVSIKPSGERPAAIRASDLRSPPHQSGLVPSGCHYCH